MRTEERSPKDLLVVPFSRSVESWLNKMVGFIKTHFNLPYLSVVIEEYSDTSHTYGLKVYIGGKFPLFQEAKSAKEALSVVRGVVIHEIAHVLYTPFETTKTAYLSMMSGRLWPKPAENLSSVQTYLDNADETHRKEVWEYIYKDLLNILEDGRIEYLVFENLDRFGGFLVGLKNLRKIHWDTMRGVDEIIADYDKAQDGMEKHVAAFRGTFEMLLTLSKYGTLKDVKEEHWDHFLLEHITEVSDYIDDAVSATDAVSFHTAANEVLAVLFDDIYRPYLEDMKEAREQMNETLKEMQEALEELRQHLPENMQQSESTQEQQEATESAKQQARRSSQKRNRNQNKSSKGNSSSKKEEGKGSESGSETGESEEQGSGQSAASETQGGQKENGESQTSGTSACENEAGKNTESGESTQEETMTPSESGGDDKNSEEEENAAKSNDGNGACIERIETNSIWSGNLGGTEFSSHDESVVNGIDLDAIERIKDAARRSENVRDYDELLRIPDLDYGNAHSGILVKNKRPDMLASPEVLKANYESFAEFIQAGRKAAEIIKPHLSPEQKAQWMKNRYYGGRFNASAAHNPNLRHFSRRTAQPKTPTLSIAILLDESGSMRGDKIRVAQATAIALYEMCEALGVPFAVFGHGTSGESSITIRNYCFFGETDKTAKYRMLSVRAHNAANRDGAALKYVAEHLSKQQTDRKLLFIISDGQPYHNSSQGIYCGTAAEEDIRRVVKEYRSRQVAIISAAIDQDKERIKGIYGAERFLSIDNIDDLPKELLTVIRRIMFY